MATVYLLAPGTYAGGHFKSGLTGVTIRSQFANNRAIINGGTNGFQFSDANRVTIEHLNFQGQTGNGINIDDGGSFSSPSTDITIRNITVRDIATSGNRDGIKLSGVTGFKIDRVKVENWGDGGSAIDMVGSHNGLIQNSHFRHETIGVGGSGLRPKGGSKNITIRANRVELPNGNGRAIQAGGSTGSQFFRFIDGDSGYEASQIRIEGNVVVNGSSSFSFVNIDGGVFHSNYAFRPDDWFVRILNENQGSSIVDTRNGQIIGNLMVFNDTGSEFNTAVNIGTETEPGTFVFDGNRWYNIADPNDSTPDLPVTETNGTYGEEPQFGIDDAVAWEFDWGIWLVNANDAEQMFEIADPTKFRLAVPGEDALFDPLAENPFQGEWTFSAIENSELQMSAFSQVYLAVIPEPNTSANLSVFGVLLLCAATRFRAQ